MSAINDGGPAFPVAPCGDMSIGSDGIIRHQFQGTSGMSLRAWLAGMEQLSEWDSPDAAISREMSEALAGCSTPQGNWSKDPIGMLHFEAKWRAAMRVIRADALIAELEKGSK